MPPLKTILETSYRMKITFRNDKSPSKFKYSIKNKNTLSGSSMFEEKDGQWSVSLTDQP